MSEQYNAFWWQGDPGYQWLRGQDVSDYDSAEKLLGRKLTEAESWAVYDNREDDNISKMGR